MCKHFTQVSYGAAFSENECHGDVFVDVSKALQYQTSSQGTQAESPVGSVQRTDAL
jgi:hypothetical protein